MNRRMFLTSLFAAPVAKVVLEVPSVAKVSTVLGLPVVESAAVPAATIKLDYAIIQTMGSDGKWHTIPECQQGFEMSEKEISIRDDSTYRAIMRSIEKSRHLKAIIL